MKTFLLLLTLAFSLQPSAFSQPWAGFPLRNAPAPASGGSSYNVVQYLTVVSSPAASFSTANTAGNAIIVRANDIGGGVISCSDSQGNTYSFSTNWAYAGNYSPSMAVMVAFAIKSGANTVTLSEAPSFGGGTYGGGYEGMTIIEVSGVSALQTFGGSSAAYIGATSLNNALMTGQKGFFYSAYFCPSSYDISATPTLTGGISATIIQENNSQAFQYSGDFYWSSGGSGYAPGSFSLQCPISTSVGDGWISIALH